MIEIDLLGRIARSLQHQLRGFPDLVFVAQPLDAAEHVAGIVLRRRRHGLEQRLGIGGLVVHRDARLGDGNFGLVQMMRRTQGGVVVLEIEARIHARLVVGRGDQAGEYLARLRFHILGEAGVAPGRAQRRVGAGAVVLGQPGARERKVALAAERRFVGEKAEDRLWIKILLPQRRLGMAAKGQRGSAKSGWRR